MQETTPQSPQMTPVKNHDASFVPPYFIGIAGGTAAGKRDVSARLREALPLTVGMIKLDSFHCQLSEKDLSHVHDYNFDHPSSFDFDEFVDCLERLRNGERVEIPVYDYVQHRRLDDKTCSIYRPDIIIVEGSLVFTDSRVVSIMDLKLFVDDDVDSRLSRRVLRDTTVKGRNVNDVIERWIHHIKPAYDEFCEPSKRHADVIIPKGTTNVVAVDLVIMMLRERSRKLGIPIDSPAP